MSWSICIDLKSFYASVECVERGLNPLTTDLVVADESRTNGTICLAISPSLKAKGIKNRCRLFEVPHTKNLIIAPPRMGLYMQVSTIIYNVYLVCGDETILSHPFLLRFRQTRSHPGRHRNRSRSRRRTQACRW